LNRIHRTLSGDPAEVRATAELLHELCASLGFNKIDAGESELAACEAMVNVIRHAWQNQPGHTMTVDADITEGKLVLEISDTGTPMPPGRIHELIHGVAPEPEDPPSRSSLREGGRGLQIIHDVMDEISYETKDGVNRMRMAKWLAKGNR
jgi:serine/threonine-protein kinase RsbW